MNSLDFSVSTTAVEMLRDLLMLFDTYLQNVKVATPKAMVPAKKIKIKHIYEKYSQGKTLLLAEMVN